MVSWRRLTFRIPGEPEEDLFVLLLEAGCLGTQRGDGVLQAWFEEPPSPACDDELAARVSAAITARGITAPLRSNEVVADGRWHERWMESLQPFAVADRFLIVPGAEVPRDAGGLIMLRLTPGRAFGTGEHVTTALCLEHLAAELGAEETLLDVGTGSGILAIAGRKLTRGSILALDTDLDSVESARGNAQANGLAGIWWLAGPLEALAPRPWDVVVANITGTALVRLMPGLARRAGRRLFITGILADEEAELAQAVEACGLRLVSIHRVQGWIGIAAERAPA